VELEHIGRRSTQRRCGLGTSLACRH
jgi:hypothetical protein